MVMFEVLPSSGSANSFWVGLGPDKTAIRREESVAWRKAGGIKIETRERAVIGKRYGSAESKHSRALPTRPVDVVESVNEWHCSQRVAPERL